MKTLNEINRKVTREYIKSAKISELEPEIIENELLPLLQKHYQQENQLLAKGEKLPIPKTLPASVIKMLFGSKYRTLNVYPNADLRGVSKLMLYDESEGIYTPNEKQMAAIIDRFNNNISSSEISTIIKKLSYTAPEACEQVSPNYIPCKNGLYNIKTGILEPFSPDRVITSKLAVDYNPNAKNVVITNKDGSKFDVDSWLESLVESSSFGKDFLLYLIRAMINPNAPLNRAFILYNPKGNNGKGTLCQLIRNIIGQSYCKSLKLEDFSKEFYLEGLINSIAVITDEANTQKIPNCSNLKALITHDPVEVNRKNREILTIKKNISILLCINEFPDFGENSSNFESLFRRLIFIPFTSCFTGNENVAIKSDYIYRKDVLEYLLYRALSLPAIDEFPEPVPCLLLKHRIQTLNDSVELFVRDVLPKTKWSLLPYEFLWDLYKSWYISQCSISTCLNKYGFGEKLRGEIVNYPQYKWCPTAQPTGSLLSQPEPLIMQYDLESWKNTNASDNDSICIPPNPSSSYTGIMKL